MLRKSAAAVWLGIKYEEDLLNMDCICLYTAKLHNREKGNGEGGCAVRSCPSVCHKWQNCCTCAGPGELAGSPGKLAAVWQQMSGFRLWHVMVLFYGSNNLE